MNDSISRHGRNAHRKDQTAGRAENMRGVRDEMQRLHLYERFIL